MPRLLGARAVLLRESVYTDVRITAIIGSLPVCPRSSCAYSTPHKPSFQFFFLRDKYRYKIPTVSPSMGTLHEDGIRLRMCQIYDFSTCFSPLHPKPEGCIDNEG